jgi:hypothetical protein
VSTVIVAADHCGPATSGNGGYAAGLVAGALLRAHDLPAVGGPWVEVTLRAPVPLQTPLTLDAASGVVTADGLLVAESRVVQTDAPVVPAVAAVGVREARAAEQHYLGLRVHPFPTCWVCGPQGAGYRLRPGAVAPGETACTWTVPPAAAPDGEPVPVEAVWAALDCPGGWTALSGTTVLVLGRLTARVVAVPALGETCVVTGRRLDTQGRKVVTGTTVWGSDGREVGRALATWISLA